MSSELKPCPFCGGPVHMVSGQPGCHYVVCEGCHASSTDTGIEKATELWNRRRLSPEDVEKGAFNRYRRFFPVDTTETEIRMSWETNKAGHIALFSENLRAMGFETDGGEDA